MNRVPTAVLVERLPFGSTSFTGCTVDEFTTGELTVTADHDGRVMEVYKPGTWLTAIQYDSLGHPLCTFTSTDAQKRSAALRDQQRSIIEKYEGKGAA